MNIITNNCLGGHIYRDVLKTEYQNPFIWCFLEPYFDFIKEYPLGTHINDCVELENFIKKQIRALDLAEIMEKKIRMDLKINSIKQDF